MPTVSPKINTSKIIGTPGGSTFTTFSVATGAVLGNYTYFLPIHIRAHVVGNVGGNWIDIDPADPATFSYWQENDGPRMAHYLFKMPGFSERSIASGLCLQCGVTYDVAKIVPLGPGVVVDAIYMEMLMFDV